MFHTVVSVDAHVTTANATSTTLPWIVHRLVNTFSIYVPSWK